MCTLVRTSKYVVQERPIPTKLCTNRNVVNLKNQLTLYASLTGPFLWTFSWWNCPDFFVKTMEVRIDRRRPTSRSKIPTSRVRTASVPRPVKSVEFSSCTEVDQQKRVRRKWKSFNAGSPSTAGSPVHGMQILWFTCLVFFLNTRIISSASRVKVGNYGVIERELQRKPLEHKCR